MMTDETTLFDGVLNWCEECPDFLKTCRGTDHPAYHPRQDLSQVQITEYESAARSQEADILLFMKHHPGTDGRFRGITGDLSIPIGMG